MKAVRIHGYGGSDVLTYEDAPDRPRLRARCSSEWHALRSTPLTAQCVRATWPRTSTTRYL